MTKRKVEESIEEVIDRVVDRVYDQHPTPSSPGMRERREENKHHVKEILVEQELGAQQEPDQSSSEDQKEENTKTKTETDPQTARNIRARKRAFSCPDIMNTGTSTHEEYVDCLMDRLNDLKEFEIKNLGLSAEESNSLRQNDQTLSSTPKRLELAESSVAEVEALFAEGLISLSFTEIDFPWSRLPNEEYGDIFVSEDVEVPISVPLTEMIVPWSTPLSSEPPPEMPKPPENSVAETAAVAGGNEISVAETATVAVGNDEEEAVGTKEEKEASDHEGSEIKNPGLGAEGSNSLRQNDQTLSLSPKRAELAEISVAEDEAVPNEEYGDIFVLEDFEAADVPISPPFTEMIVFRSTMLSSEPPPEMPKPPENSVAETAAVAGGNEISVAETATVAVGNEEEETVGTKEEKEASDHEG